MVGNTTSQCVLIKTAVAYSAVAELHGVIFSDVCGEAQTDAVSTFVIEIQNICEVVVENTRSVFQQFCCIGRIETETADCDKYCTEMVSFDHSLHRIKSADRLVGSRMIPDSQDRIISIQAGADYWKFKNWLTEDIWQGRVPGGLKFCG